jgi:hypothetical protein
MDEDSVKLVKFASASLSIRIAHRSVSDGRFRFRSVYDCVSIPVSALPIPVRCPWLHPCVKFAVHSNRTGLFYGY